MIAHQHVVVRIELGELLQTYITTRTPLAPQSGVLLQQGALLGNAVQGYDRYGGAAVGILVADTVHLVNFYNEFVVALFCNSGDIQIEAGRLTEESVNGGVNVLAAILSGNIVDDVE